MSIRTLSFSSLLRKTAFVSMAAAVALPGMQAQAYQIFFGEDLTPGNGANVPLSVTPNATAANNQFLSQLIGVGTETFEIIAPGTTAPLTLTFPGAGTAILTGQGVVASVTPGTTNGAGRYSVPSTTSSHYWEVDAGGTPSFSIAFSNVGGIAAFGFYGIDVGDFGGTLQLLLTNGTTTTLNIPNAQGSGINSPEDGSVLFYGIIAQNPSELFSNASFNTTAGTGDVFAFDNMTIGSIQQVRPVPEPASIALLGIGLAGLGFARRRKVD